MQEYNNLTASPSIVLREEFEDSALLYNPDSGSIFGLNSQGVFIWKRLDGLHSEEDILKELQQHFDKIPAGVDTHLKDFIQSLIAQGLVE